VVVVAMMQAVAVVLVDSVLQLLQLVVEVHLNLRYLLLVELVIQ
jgi:hypothetical protein